MTDDKTILDQIKKAVQEIVPGAKVILFGSRVTGNIHEESDWDILVLTRDKPDRKLKIALRDRLYLLLNTTGAYISSIVTSEYEWENNAAYYSLQKSIEGESELL